MEPTILLCSGRTGSTLVIDIMRQHPELNVAPRGGEPFNQWGGGVSFPSIFEDPIPQEVLGSLHWYKHARKSHLEKALGKCDLMKILYHHVSESMIPLIRETKVIHLTRRNKLEHHVSVLAAKDSGIYSQVEYDGHLTLDLDEFLSFADHTLTKERLWRQWHPNACEITYEGLKQFPKATIKKVCDFLEIPHFDFEIRMNKQVKRPMSEVITNYREFSGYDHEWPVL